MSDFKVIPTNAISTITEVRLYQETVEKVLAGHPEVRLELPSISTAVENAIVNPTSVEESYNKSYVFVDETSTNWSGDPLRVPIKVIDEEGKSGRVKSIYFGSGPTDAEVIYTKDVIKNE